MGTQQDIIGRTVKRKWYRALLYYDRDHGGLRYIAARGANIVIAGNPPKGGFIHTKRCLLRDTLPNDGEKRMLFTQSTCGSNVATMLKLIERY